MPSLHSPRSVRSFSRCGFTICGREAGFERSATRRPPLGVAAKAFCHVCAHLKLPREDPARVDVAGVGLEGLVVPQDLGGGRGGHGSQQQAVPDAVSEDAEARARLRTRPSIINPDRRPELTERFFPLELPNPTNLSGFSPTCRTEGPGRGNRHELKRFP